MKRISLIFLTSLAVLACGLNLLAVVRLNHQKAEETDVADLLDQTKASVESAKLTREAAYECIEKNDDLCNRIHQLIDAFHKNEQPLPTDTFSSEFNVGFFSVSGAEDFRLHAWVPAGKSIEFSLQEYRNHRRLGESPRTEPQKELISFEEAGWHSIACRVVGGEFVDAMILTIDGEDEISARLESKKHSRGFQFNRNCGNIWPILSLSGKQMGMRGFEDFAWNLTSKDERGKVIQRFTITPKASK